MSLQIKFSACIDLFDLEVEFSIGNEIAVLFGPSGAGKTLTLKMLAGLLNPDQGHVLLNSKILFDSEKQICVRPQDRHVGYVFQNHSLFPHMNVLQNIKYGARTFDKKETEAMAREWINTLSLQGLEYRYPKEISGGQQQRVALARALIQKPAALLLDEPFSALDNPTRIKMRECLKKIIKQLNIPVVFVTHDIFEAYALADHMFVFFDGGIVQCGTPQSIKKAPINEDVRLLCLMPE